MHGHPMLLVLIIRVESRGITKVFTFSELEEHVGLGCACPSSQKNPKHWCASNLGHCPLLTGRLECILETEDFTKESHILIELAEIMNSCKCRVIMISMMLFSAF